MPAELEIIGRFYEPAEAWLIISQPEGLLYGDIVPPERRGDTRITYEGKTYRLGDLIAAYEKMEGG